MAVSLYDGQLLRTHAAITLQECHSTFNWDKRTQLLLLSLPDEESE